VYAWTFLVPAVAVVVDAIQGNLPNSTAMFGVALVILGVAVVNLPRADGEPVGDGTEASQPGTERSFLATPTQHS
jgi:drug/metabolite transporter (DMT)-like permease